MKSFKSILKRFLVLTLSLALLFGALPDALMFALNENQTDLPSFDFGSNEEYDGDDFADDIFVPEEVLASADSLENAQGIAAAYGLEFKSYAWGVAVLTAPEPEQTVAQSNFLSNLTGSLTDRTILPKLSLNMLYSLSEDDPDPPPTSTIHNSGDENAATYASGSGQEYYAAADYGESQWHHELMDSRPAWEITTGKGVVIAVLDSGINLQHFKFAGKVLPNSYRSSTDQVGLEYVADSYGHGTHVSGIAAASMEGDPSICGIAPDASILMIKITHPKTNIITSESWVRGLNYAVENSADVANMSFGRGYATGLNEIEESALENAMARGVSIVCAAGNSSSGHAGFPAAYPGVIAVSALDPGGLPASYTNYGPEIAVAAPGTDINSTSISGGYIVMSGTSMASPAVAGVVALIKSLHPEYTAEQVRNLICDSARSVGTLGHDLFYGSGMVNAYGAVLGIEGLLSVNFDLNYDELAPAAVKVIPGQKVIEPNPDWLIRRGYLFDKWGTSAGGGEAFDFSTEINEDLTLYAQWHNLEPDMYAAQFPDPKFRMEVLRLLNTRDNGSRTGYSLISPGDAAILNSYTTLTVRRMMIRDLTGIEHFGGLRQLDCSGNQISFLDLAKNTALTNLTCYNNQLNSLNLSQNNGLTYLSCFTNNLNILDLSQNRALTNLSCSNNLLSSLDLANNTALTSLDCSENRLEEIDIANNTAISTFKCANNRLSELDLTNNTAHKELYCNDNRLTFLDVANKTALTTLSCYQNQMKELDTSNCTALRNLYCRDNQLETLDVSANTSLQYLLCNNNLLTELDLSNNTKLSGMINLFDGIVEAGLDCSANLLTELDLTKNTALTVLNCSENPLGSLNLVNNTRLGVLWCRSIRLTELDLSQNTVLQILYCENNLIKELDLANKTRLQRLYCDNNLLTKLSIPDSTGLAYLWCNNNLLSELNVSNSINLLELHCEGNQIAELDLAKNTRLNSLHCSANLLTELDVSKNPRLIELYCSNNRLRELNLTNNTGSGGLCELDCRYNYLPSEAALIGFESIKDRCWVYFFHPQNPLSGVSVSGKIKSYNPLKQTTIQLMKDEEPVYTEIVAGKSGYGLIEQDFVIPGVEPDTYSLVIKKDAHTKFTVLNFVVGEEEDLDLTLDNRPEVQLMALRCGDINGDGLINDADLTVLWRAGNYNKKTAEAENEWCDLNGDGLINDADLTILWMVYNYNRGEIIIP